VGPKDSLEVPVKIHPGRLFFFAVSALLLCSTPATLFASDDTAAREVRLSWVQGDVRLSRGNGKHTDLNKPWEQAQGGELLEQGFAVATGIGRAEIEFEDGSTGYLAEHSLLLFGELSARGERVFTRMTLPTGTATFALQPAAGESFFIETPTDNIQTSAPETFFARMDAYLDATAITPQGENGEVLIRNDHPNLAIPNGHTLFFQQGEVVNYPNQAQAGSSTEQDARLSLHLSGLQAIASTLRASGLAPLVPGGLMLQSLPLVHSPILQTPPVQPSQEFPPSLLSPSPAVTDWDNWVSSRVQQRAAITMAALKSSGLSSPILGLNDLYTNGSFFQCAPYGTCWEPTQEAQQARSPQTSQPNAQSPSQNAPNSGFPTQTVEWTERVWRVCDSFTARRVSRIAHSQQELDELLRQKAVAEHGALTGTAYSDSCWNGVWIHHHGHFARVLTPRKAPVCLGTACKRVHPPRPIWVRAGNKVGFVPRHPNDVKGKPPVNLKNGILIPAVKPGEPLQRITVDSSQKVKILEKAPREFQRESVARALPVSAPEIRGHLMQEVKSSKSNIVTNRADSHIVYDYKFQKFMMPASVVAGAKTREVPVGGISSKGTVASFADGRSSHYAQSFGRTSAAASYNGGGHNPGSYNGGGRGSGSYSSSSSYSGGGNAGSHSSSSSSSAGSSSHSSSGSSGGGGGVSSSSNSSSSSSSSSSGGGNRGRP
jgi:hypothetical protein